MFRGRLYRVFRRRLRGTLSGGTSAVNRRRFALPFCGFCFRRNPIGRSGPGGDDDLGLSFLRRIRRRYGRRALFLDNDHFLNGTLGGSSLFPLSVMIVFLPLDKLYLGFLRVI
jgi:hypothetical protein